jgi:selenocysteine-specific elongation factor
MKHLVIGTAGHVDHGKTCLTKALTGVDTDRLKEEHKRGITIEIGFAQLTLPNGQCASIVDVPGHEKLIRNMLVGATGIDVVLLVVAADEGFMPQTREHLDILSLLNVKNGIIVLTKCDMADSEWLEAVMEDTRENVKGSFLENAPMLPVSSYTGEGIEELKRAIVNMVETSPARPDDRPFRLPVDRAFSIRGFGTVVTGTLVDGSIQTGDTVMIYPECKQARVRELQNHDTKQSEVEAGMRVAINLSGVDRDELSRGCTVAAPGSMLLSRQIAVRLQMTKDSPYRVKNSSLVHFYEGTQERVCKVRLLSAAELGPGEWDYAVLSFKEALTARNYDRFIIRFFSPMTTVGGGVILDMRTKRLKREDTETLERLERLNSDTDRRLWQMVEDAELSLVREEELISVSGLAAGEVRSALAGLVKSGEVLCIREGYVTAKALSDQWVRTEALLKSYHQEQSLTDGLHLGELREKLFSASPKTADAILDYYARQGKLCLNGSSASLTGFQTAFSPEQQRLCGELERYYLDCGFEAPLNTEAAERFADRAKLYRQVSSRMLRDGTLTALNAQYTVHSEYCRRALETFLGMFECSDTASLGDFRTKIGVSRKFAQQFLDYFDGQRISKLVGDSRVLLRPKG